MEEEPSQGDEGWAEGEGLAPPPPPPLEWATDTSFISEELLSRATRDSTLVESGQKQGWSGFRILPSSGMQVCIQVSKKGTSAPVLDSDRITWERQKSHQPSGEGTAPCLHAHVSPSHLKSQGQIGSRRKIRAVLPPAGGERGTGGPGM